MTRLLQSLPPQVRHRLIRLGRWAEDVDWPIRLAHSVGWQQANTAYQVAQRQLGAAEMRALLESLHLEPPLEPAQTREVLLTALELFFHTTRITAAARAEDGAIRVEVTHCPTFDRSADVRWGGLATCGCFARRRGWYEVLGIPPDEELVTLRMWGDPVCELVIHVPQPQPVAATG